jgi:hypothetical protein
MLDYIYNIIYIYKIVEEDVIMLKKGLIYKAIVCGLASLMVASTMTGCKGKSANATVQQETTTATNIMAVTLKDKDGKDIVLEGVGVSDETGKTTITVTDKDGNELIVSGETTKDENGNVTVKNPVIVSGDNITTNDGTTVDMTGATVGNVTNNDDGTVATDVAVSDEQREDTKKKQEETNAETSAPTQGQTDRQTEQQTERQTEPVTDAPTQRQTDAPTNPPTQAPTDPPTEAPTEAPTAPHGVAVGTKTLAIVYHGRQNEVIHTSYLDYPVDAYGDATEGIYDTVEDCCYFPAGYPDNVDYIICAYVFSNNRLAYREVDLRDHMVNGQVDVYMDWMPQ